MTVSKTGSVGYPPSLMPSTSPGTAGLRRLAELPNTAVKQPPRAVQDGLAKPSGPFAGTSSKPRLEAPGQPIDKIYINPDPEHTKTIAALQEIGKRRGFNVDTRSGASADIWAEDNAIVFRDQAGKSSLLVSGMKEEVFRQARADLARFAGAGSETEPTTAPAPADGIGSAWDTVGDTVAKHFGDVGNLGRAFNSNRSLDVGKAAKASGWDVRATPIGLEGGNVLSMRNRGGENVALVGRNSLLMNWRALANTKQLDTAAVNRVLTTKSFDAALASELQQISQKGGRPITNAQASRMAAEVEVAKGAIAGALNLDKNKVVFIEQAGFHIDMETRPIGDNKVMVSDLKSSVNMLTQSIAELRATAPSAAKDAGAIQAEIKQLEALRTRTESAIENGDQHLLDRKANTLRSAGMEVVRAPTNFGDIASTFSPTERKRSGRQGPVNVNFANGIAATDKRGSPYFITNFSASETLNKKFSASMKARGIDVEWAPTGTLLNQLGGIDCITLHAKRQAAPQRPPLQEARSPQPIAARRPQNAIASIEPPATKNPISAVASPRGVSRQR
jgi:hypothetical protein